MAQNPTPTQITDSTGTTGATLFKLANADPVTVAVVDAAGNQITSFGGGSGSNAAAGATGGAVPVDADYAGVNIGGNLAGVTGLATGATVKAMTVAVVDGSGNQITAFGGSGGNAAASPTGSAVPADADYIGYNSGTALVGVSSSTPLPVTLANTGANATAVKVDNSGVTQPVSGTVGLSAGTAVELLDSAGANKASINAAGALKVDGSAVTQPVSGTFWQATQPVSGTVTVQQSTAANLKVDLSGTAANATAIKVDGSGVTQPVSGTITANAGTGTFNTQDAATGSTAATAPTKAIEDGAIGQNALPTSVTNGQLVGLMADLAGRLITRSAGPRELLTVNNLTLSATGNNTLIAAGAAGVFRDLTFLQASNTSATAVRIDISDGTRTYSWYLAASGGGFNINFDPPLKATAAATAWTAAISGAVTDVRVGAQSVDTK